MTVSLKIVGNYFYVLDECNNGQLVIYITLLRDCLYLGLNSIRVLNPHQCLGLTIVLG